MNFRPAQPFAHVLRVSCEQRDTHHEMWAFHYGQDFWNKKYYGLTVMSVDVA